MNILEICLAPALGGLELYFHRCCVELQKRGHVVVSVRLPGSRLENLGKSDGVTMRTMERGNKFFPWRHSRELSKIIHSHQIDVVHVHHKDDLPLVALTKSTGRRSFHLAFTRQMPMKQGKKDPYHRWLYTKIDLFLTITELLKRDALAKLPIPAERIQRLYYGVAAPPVRDESFLTQFKSITKPGGFSIGVFSRLEFQKGQHLVIESLKKIIDKGVPASLYLVGDVMSPDYERSLRQQIITLGLEDRVSFKGFLPQPMMGMMGMDVLVLPSRNEAFGLVLIEAMRCGVAVIGVNAGGVPEIIDDEKTGLLFEWDDTQKLASQLERLYRENVFRAELALRGKEKADTEFNNDLHFQRLEAFLASLTAG